MLCVMCFFSLRSPPAGFLLIHAFFGQHYASLPPPKSPSSSELPFSGSGNGRLQGTYVFIHGWVYDVENGEVSDLNVSLGPPGREIPKSPWPATEERERRKRSGSVS